MRLKWVYALLVVPLLIMMSIAVLPDEGMVSGAPTARFTYSPLYPDEGDVITFDASNSFGEGLNYSWDFDDGTQDTGEMVSHIYEEWGYYDVVLTVQDSEGLTDTYHEEVHVSEDLGSIAAVLGLSMLAFMIIYILVIMLAILLYLLNPILGGILAYKGYQKAKAMNQTKAATPYLIGHLVAGVVSMFMVYFVLFSIIGHIVIYIMLKKKLKELGQGPPPGPPQFAPPPQFNQAPPMHQPPPQRPPQASPRPQSPPPQARPPPQAFQRPPQ